jgi:hypothetical protein
MNVENLIKQYGNNKNIQTSKEVMRIILSHLSKMQNPKMLVFGLGYDSQLWFNATNKNTFFIEDNKTYIDLCKNKIPLTNVCHFVYNTKVKFGIPNNLNSVSPPQHIIKNAPYDAIFIDGPAGYDDEKPGRTLPMFWCNQLCAKGGLIFIDDSNRKLEKQCIEKFFTLPEYRKVAVFDYRDGFCIFEKS